MLLIFGCTFSVLLLLIVGFTLLRNRAQKRAKQRLWEERQRNLKRPSTEQSETTWHDNQHMNMR